MIEHKLARADVHRRLFAPLAAKTPALIKSPVFGTCKVEGLTGCHGVERVGKLLLSF